MGGPGGGPRGGPHGMHAGEKAKDFKKSWKQLFIYSKKYAPIVLLALVLAAGGTVFSFIGPDRLRDMTDEIVRGLPALIDGQPVVGAINMKCCAEHWIFVGVLLCGSGDPQFCKQLYPCDNERGFIEKDEERYIRQNQQDPA